jgi:hypothetical protein
MGFYTFGFVVQGQAFRSSVLSRQVYLHRDTSLPGESFFVPHFIAADSSPAVWMEMQGHINHMCGEMPTDIRKRVLVPFTNYVGLISLTMTPRKAAAQSPLQNIREARQLEDWLETQPQLISTMDTNPDSYNAVLWVTTWFS